MFKRLDCEEYDHYVNDEKEVVDATKGFVILMSLAAFVLLMGFVAHVLAAHYGYAAL